MIHITTKNYSFLKVYHMLKEKGVENNTFFLELYDETLLDVDPFDEDNLTDDQKNRILIEVTRNPWYYLRECVRIAASGIVPYELHLGNLAFTWCVINNLNVYMVLARQRGKTTAAAAIISWVFYFGGLNTETMLFANTNKNLTNNTNRIKAIRQNLPTYLQLHNSKVDRDGSELMTFTALGNKIMKQAPKRSEEGADSVGRGFSPPIVWYDEFGFIPHIRTQFQASVLAQTTIAKIAEKNGLPHSIMITTTAAFLNTESGKYAHQFFMDSFEFTESIYDMDILDVKTMMSNESSRNFIRIEYPYWELNVEDNYFKEQCEALHYDQDAIDREVLNKWKSVSTTHPLGQNAIALLEEYIKKPTKIVVLNKIYRLKLYKDPSQLDWSVPYIIGGDCSNNVGEDYSSLVILDPRNYEIIGVLRTNLYSTMLYAQMIADLMKHYFFNGILVVERNLNGATILDRIMEIEPSLNKRIYSTPNITHSKTNRFSKDMSRPLEKYGISTSENSRKLLYNQILKVTVDENYKKIHDYTIISEIKSLIRLRSGRIDHPSGGHDDTLISYLFTMWFCLYGENVERYLSPMLIGVFNDIDGSDEKEILKKKEKKMKEIQNKLHQTDDSNIDNRIGKLMTLIEQKRSLDKGENLNNILNVNENEVDGIFEKASSLISEKDSNTFMTSSDGKMYTIDVDEDIDFKNEKEIEEMEKYESEMYSKNPKNIQIDTKIEEDKNQFIRQIVQPQVNQYNDFRWFMNQFR